MNSPPDLQLVAIEERVKSSDVRRVGQVQTVVSMSSDSSLETAVPAAIPFKMNLGEEKGVEVDYLVDPALRQTLFQMFPARRTMIRKGKWN